MQNAIRVISHKHEIFSHINLFAYFFKMLRQLEASQAVKLTQATLQALKENKVGNYVHYKESLT